MDRQRVDLLSKLVNIMLRQLRVRYELKLTDLLRAYVHCSECVKSPTLIPRLQRCTMSFGSLFQAMSCQRLPTDPAFFGGQRHSSATGPYRGLVPHQVSRPPSLKINDSNLRLRSLQRDNKHATEREQAIKLIRTIIEVGTTRKSSALSPTSSGSVNLSEAVMRAFIAVAEHPEDPFRPICIQTLTEICWSSQPLACLAHS